MASGSNNLTSYKAKQIIGSSIAASPSGALLLTGEHYTGNTWLYHYGYGGTTNPWGIFHDTTAEKLIIKGSGTDSFWIKMNTGDTYVLGKMGIGYDPNTTGNNYKLYVNGSAYFNIGTSDNTTDLKFVINGNGRYLALGAGGIQARTSADAVTTLYLNYNGGTTYVGGNSYLVGSVGIGYNPDTSGNTYKLYVNGSTNITGTTTFGDYLYRAYTASNQTPMIWMNSSDFDNYLWQIGSGTANGKQYYGYGLKYIGTGSGAANYLQLIADNQNGTDVIAIGINQSGQIGLGVNANTNYRLYVSGTITATDTIYANGGYLKSTMNSNTVTIGSQNTSFTHIYNSANIPFIFNKDVLVTDTKNLGSTSWPWGNLYIGKADGAGIYYVTDNYTKEVIRFLNHSADQYGVGLKICTGGVVIIGAGESGDTVQTNLAPASGAETLYLASDGSILLYPGQNSYDAAALITMTAGRIWAGVNGNTTRENQIGVQSGAGQIYLYSQAGASAARGLYITAHGTGSALGIIEINTNNSTVIRGHDTWGGKLRMVDNWLGFYSAALNTGTRYGYIQANADRMYFRKENGISTYGFDFNSHLYTTGGYYSTTSGGLSITPAGTPWPYINFGTNAGGSTYVSIAQSTWCQLYTELPVKRASDNYYYRARFFFREYSHNGSGTRVNYYEDYYLPQCNNSRTANQGYNILTSKDMSFSITGNAATAGKVGAAASWLYFNNSNEVNFGGTNTSTTIYFGYRATDSRGKPTEFVFGSGNGTALVKCNRIIACSTTDAAPGSVAAVALITGDTAGTHMEIDNNEIIAKTNASTKGILYLNESGYVASDGKIHNAVWNDFAEYRASDINEPGRVVISDGKGKVVLSTERLQSCAHVISDTYGIAVGESNQAKTPLGVAGRVLVIPYQDRNKYKIGDCLCTAPDGTADIMTREEIIKYPDKIIGIVDEIPDYESWNQTFTTKKRTTQMNTEINGRIWIYVR